MRIINNLNEKDEYHLILTAHQLSFLTFILDKHQKKGKWTSSEWDLIAEYKSTFIEELKLPKEGYHSMEEC